MQTSIYALSRAVLLIVAVALTGAAHAATANTENVSNGRNKAVAALSTEARHQLDAGDVDAASATVERALRIAPNDASVWRLLSEVRRRQGDPAQADALIARAEVLEPNRVRTKRERSESTEEAVSLAGEADEYGVPLQQAPKGDLAWTDSRDALATTLEDYDDWEPRAMAPPTMLQERQPQNPALSESARQAERERVRLLSELRAAQALQSVVNARSTDTWDSDRHAQKRQETRPPAHDPHQSRWRAENDHANNVYDSRKAWKRAKREARKARRAEKRAWREERRAAKHAWRHLHKHGRGRGPRHAHGGMRDVDLRISSRD